MLRHVSALAVGHLQATFKIFRCATYSATYLAAILFKFKVIIIIIIIIIITVVIIFFIIPRQLGLFRPTSVFKNLKLLL